jgi:hypothetical protein
MSALAVLAIAVPAHAAVGTYNLSWDTCTGPLDRTITPDALNSLYASVIGHDVPHLGYEVKIIYGNGTTRTVPDAWRFDAPGCQGSSFLTIDHLAPSTVVKACPSFHPPVASVPIKDASFVEDTLPGTTYDATLMKLTMAVAYPDGAGQNINPATRYFLARFLFDHTFSVTGAGTPGETCGGLEQSICFATVNSSYLDAEGTEFLFSNGGNRTVSANGVSGCTPSPVLNRTWGSIKSQYRN